MAKRRGNSFGAARNGSGNAFGNFARSESFTPRDVTPIRTEFSAGSVPDSIYSLNRESAWSRWRRGFEIYCNSSITNTYSYPFDYLIPLPPGTVIPPGANPPKIPGAFQGFPTTNKELCMHWSGVRIAGSLRFDNVRDKDGDPSPILSVTEDDNYWYVTLSGDWSASNPLPAPLFIPPVGPVPKQYPINGEILEDRIISVGGTPITSETIDPTTQRRYGYVQAVLVATDEEKGILTLQKQGSVESTPDGVFRTPATRPPNVGRYLMTGTRYCCSCQDFTRRDYAYMMGLGKGNQKVFPRTRVATIKPGRYEIMTLNGKVNNSAMTSATVNRRMEVIAPNETYDIPPTITPDSTINTGALRDNPGVFRDFGKTYIRNTPLPSLEGARAEGPPTYEDYSTTRNPDGSYNITSLTDFWSPLLDELRYCKHIYAMKFTEKVFPPEPSDLPVEMGSITAWEQRLVEETARQNEKSAYALAERGLSMMDVPPYNCQAPMMMPMMQKLFNVPSTFVLMSGFRMFDKNGKEYNPSTGGRPEV